MAMNYAKCQTERAAIREARRAAIRESLSTEDGSGVARVILASGDTLTITAHGGRRVRYHREPGWIRDGFVFCGPRAYVVGVM